MFAKHGKRVKLVDADAKGSSKHLESRIQVIRGHTFWDHSKAVEELRITV